jgi:NADH:ubiquinone oxidoreductase subunit C
MQPANPKPEEVGNKDQQGHATTGNPPPPASSSSPPPPPVSAGPVAPAPPATPATTAAASPLASRTKALADKIVERFPSTRVDYVREKRVKVTVAPDQIKAVALFVRDVLGFDHLNVVGGTDYMQQKEFEVIYFVGSISTPGQQDLVVQLAERVKRDEPNVPSLADVWVASEYHERETFEMLGIQFEGHPDLRRLLLPEDWNDIPPLRKDYNSPGR